jgi:azurin
MSAPMNDSSRSPFGILWLLAGFVLAGCGRPESPSPASGVAVAPQSADATGPRRIEIVVNDSMKFSLTRIEAAAGETFTLVLRNTGTMSKEAMGHNWVLLSRDADVKAFVAAAAAAKATDYIPASAAGEVLAHTRMLGGRQSDTIEVKVPDVPGTYPYLCSFPGHTLLGMQGVLVVR